MADRGRVGSLSRTTLQSVNEQPAEGQDKLMNLINSE